MKVHLLVPLSLVVLALLVQLRPPVDALLLLAMGAKVMVTTMPPMVVKFHVLQSLMVLAPPVPLPTPVGVLLLLVLPTNSITMIMLQMDVKLCMHVPPSTMGFALLAPLPLLVDVPLFRVQGVTKVTIVKRPYFVPQIKRW